MTHTKIYCDVERVIQKHSVHAALILWCARYVQRKSLPSEPHGALHVVEIGRQVVHLRVHMVRVRREVVGIVSNVDHMRMRVRMHGETQRLIGEHVMVVVVYRMMLLLVVQRIQSHVSHTESGVA